MKKKIDILNGNIYTSLIWFALPIALSSLLQQLFSTADQIVVGQFTGSTALAAVGANAPIVGLLVNVFSSIAVGTNAQIAKAIGSGVRKDINKMVHTSIAFAGLSGVILLIITQIVARPMHLMIRTPQNVLPEAVNYLRIYSLGFPFAMIYNFGSAILRSKGDTKRPMIALTSAGVVNIFLNLFFVIVLKMGVVGVAYATSISNVISAVWILLYLTKEEDDMKLSINRLRIDRKNLLEIIQIGGPAAIQSAVFSVANISIQSGINHFGSNAMAGSAAAQNFENISYFFINAYGQALTTFCGQNYGAKKLDRCKKVIKTGFVESLIVVATFDILVYVARKPLIGFFTSDPEVLYYAYKRLAIVVGLHFMISSYELFAAAMRSLGYALMPALLTIIGCVAFRITWLLTVFATWRDYSVLLAVYPASWILTGSLVTGYYFLKRKNIYNIDPVYH